MSSEGNHSADGSAPGSAAPPQAAGARSQSNVRQLWRECQRYQLSFMYKFHYPATPIGGWMVELTVGNGMIYNVQPCVDRFFAMETAAGLALRAFQSHQEARARQLATLQAERAERAEGLARPEAEDEGNDLTA